MIECLFLGKANTDGDAVIWLPMQKVLVAGDVIVSPIPYGSESYAQEWLAALTRLDGMDFAYLIPGHGAVQRDHLYLRKVASLLREMRSQIDPLARDGLSLEEVNKRVNFKAQIDSFAGNSRWRRSEFNGYFLLSMITNVYLEAKGQPVVQGQPYL